MSIDKVDLLEADGTTLVAHLPATVIDAPADRRNDVTRMLTFEVRMEYLQALKILGRMIKAYDGTTQVFVGYPDTPTIKRTYNTSLVTVPCRDKARRPKDSLFESDTIFESAPTDDTVSYTATASSTLPASSSIQSYGQVIGAQLARLNINYDVSEMVEITFQSRFGGVLTRTFTYEQFQNVRYPAGSEIRRYSTYHPSGTTSELIESSEVSIEGDPLTGVMNVAYAGTDEPSRFRLTVDIDMRSVEAVSSITPTTNGTIMSQYVSSDGIEWTAWSVGASGRYLRVVIEKATMPITLSLAITATTDYQPSNVATDDGASYRPLPTDFSKVLTLMFSAATLCNTVYIRSGTDNSDTSTRLFYAIDGTADGTNWTELIAEASGTPNRLAEHLFDQASLKGIRLRILSCNGPVAIRYIRVANIVSTEYVHDVIQSILEDCGETEFDFTETRQYVGLYNAECGISKLAVCKELAATAGMELFWTREGVCTLRPAEDYDITDEEIPADMAILDLSAEWSSDVKNEIVGICDLPDTQLAYTARDEVAGSLTCVQRIGHRTKVVQFPEADTIEKLENATKQELLKSLRRGSTVEYRVTAEPDMEVGRIRYVVDTESGVSGFYAIDAYRLEWSPDASTYDMVCQGRQV